MIKPTIESLTADRNGVMHFKGHAIAVVLGKMPTSSASDRACVQRLLQHAPRFYSTLHRISASISPAGEITNQAQLTAALSEARGLLALVNGTLLEATCPS